MREFIYGLTGETFVLSGRVEHHFPDCRCTTARMWWPCWIEEASDVRT